MSVESVVARAVTVMMLCGLGVWAAVWADDAVVRAAGGNPSLGTPAWVELQLEARKLFMKATTRLSVRLESTVSVEGDLRSSPEGKVNRPSGPEVAVVSLSSDLPFGRFETSRAWIDPTTGTAFQGERLSTGRKSSWKLWRYLDGGKYVWRVSPEGKREEDLDRSAWTRRRQRFEGWEGSVPSGLVVSDSYALLYLVSASRLDREGGKLEFCLEADDRLVAASFVAGEVITDRFEFEQVQGGTVQLRKGEMRARAVRGLGRPVAGGETEEDVDLGFLGLKGEITILLEEGTGVPLEVRGRAQGVGKVTVRMRRVVMAEPEPGAGG